MKKAVLLVLILLSAKLHAQDTLVTKPLSLGLHFFYNDFVTPQRIATADAFTVIGKGNWGKASEMQGGFGLDILQGLRPKTDFVGTVNAAWVNYLLPSGADYGSTNMMLDINAGFHFKSRTDKHTINPFLITKVGYSFYRNFGGFMLYPGLGIQGNFFDQFFIISTLEYKLALSSHLSNQFSYSIGVATNIKGPKLKKPKVADEESKPVNNEIKKDIVVVVTDEATGQLLPFVEVSLESDGLNSQTQFTNENGKVIFYTNPPREYFVSGRLNKIEASNTKFTPADFAKEDVQLVARLKHNDPRFTLLGNTINLSTGKPVGGTTVTTQNTTQASTSFSTSVDRTGQFQTQLEAGSDFVIFGKKANYMSNIERISTAGLNRSTTLFVKLQLGVEEVIAGRNIVLNKIYFESAKVALNTSASGDLERLVQFLKDNPQVRLEIQGHTDSKGSAAINRRISQQRADNVVSYLVGQGIKRNNLVAKGFGPDRPIASNATPEGMASNRRVEMRML